MKSRTGIQGVASSPVIVGAITVLVIIVAVFLAYNANNGLPFVSTYDLKARVPNANALVKGNEVRIGGSRVGVISSVVPVQLPNGELEAELNLKLDESAKPIPADSTMVIRPKSPLGLKFLEIHPGNSDEGLESGGTLPVTAAKPEPVDIDQFFDIFDEPTRRAVQKAQAGFGDALAGRGPQLNEALGALRGLVENGRPILQAIAAPSTNFSGFWRSLEDLAATVAPVASTQAAMFVALDRTFAAFARVSRPYIQETISKSPPTLDTAIEDLPALRPFLRHTEQFFVALEPGSAALARTSPTIESALRAGVPALNRSPSLFAQLTPTADALVAFQNAPGVEGGLRLLTETNQLLDPAITFIAPAQTVCNYLSLTFRNLADAFKGTNGANANWLAATTFEAPPGPNGLGGAAAAPADGPEPMNHVNVNPYPNTAAPGQTHECEAGRTPFQRGETVIGNTPGNQGTTTLDQIKGQG